MLRLYLEEILRTPPIWLRPVLFPLSVLYAGGSALHRALYRVGLLKSSGLPRPVISVGNLTAGGGGKTPIVMWLAESLETEGLKPAILSRGYGRKSEGVRIVDPECSWQIFGDEPSMMARKLLKIPVVVSANRRLAGLEILKRQETDLFILDDGFQHRALKRDLDIITVDNTRRFGTGRLLPAGILREPVKMIKEADVVVVTKADNPDPDFGSYLSSLFSGPVLWADFRPDGLLPLKGDRSGNENGHAEGPFLGFCGIADPDGFRTSLDHMGLIVQDLLVFPDHHPYNDMDVTRILQSARKAGAKALVTTEKDAVRLPDYDHDMPCYVLTIKAVLPGSASLLINQVKALFQSSRGPA